jgi:hypothetical protein
VWHSLGRLKRLVGGDEAPNHHSGLAPESFTTFAHFSVSSAKKFRNSPGVVTSAAA